MRTDFSTTEHDVTASNALIREIISEIISHLCHPKVSAIIKHSTLFNTGKTIPTSLSSPHIVSQSTHGFKGLLGPVAGL
mgnify:CR=1 FL=1